MLSLQERAAEGRSSFNRGAFESLESRRLMSVSVWVDDGTLFITGDGGMNEIHVSKTDGVYEVWYTGNNSQPDWTSTGSPGFTHLDVDAGADDDQIIVGSEFYLGNGNEPVDLSTELKGGAGHDTIYGGDVYNTLWGGTGNDTMVNYLGSTTFYGGDGDDTMYGGGYDDVFYGGDGDDWMMDNTVDRGPDYDSFFGEGGDDWIQTGDFDNLDVADGGQNGSFGDTFIANGDGDFYQNFEW